MKTSESFLKIQQTMTNWSTGLAKTFLVFLSKNKRYIFHFHQEPHWTIYSPFCFTTFCHFFKQLHNSIFPKHFIFLSKELFQVLFTENWHFPENWHFFHLENMVKEKINGIWRYNVWWIEHMNQNFPAKLKHCLPSHQRNMVSCVILTEDFGFSVD